MSIKHLIFQSLKKNIKNYYLYVFALIFSVGLYFAFVTLQYDPAMDETSGTIKGGAAIKAASVLLFIIISIFLLYANKIFIKRRSKEIGLFQLIGMTKRKVFQILATENAIIYFSSLIIGTFVGFAFSKLAMMILFRITAVDDVAKLHFSIEAFVQTIIVFSVIFLFILLMNYIFIKKQSILALFNTQSSTENKIKKISVFEIVIGIVGIALILVGYYISSKLFDGDFVGMNGLFLAMIFILVSVILGTYLFYKGSVTFILNVIRKRKDGYLTVNQVLSLSSLMFRMKSNALLLTIITTVSALAIGLLSLSYISYYSAEKNAENSVAADFAITDQYDAKVFMLALDKNNIAYSDRTTAVLEVNVNVENILDTQLDEVNSDPNMILPVISDQDVDGINVSSEETIFTGYSAVMSSLISFKDSGDITLTGQKETIKQSYIGLQDKFVLSNHFTHGGLPVAIVDESIFLQLQNDINPEIQDNSSIYIGIDMQDKSDIKKANDIFLEKFPSNGDYPYDSRYNIANSQKQNMGLIMFIVGFLGLSFLITSGCILYFKQMDEGEEEKSNYTILRKLGFTQGDLIKGIQLKQLFNFGIPLVVGLSHSYFAVQSGWFFFGTELWTPLIIVMIVYTVLYSIFGLLSVLYYKNIISDAL
ncbi:ABC transporter permease [Paraliobacillus sediminis]|uniref:ABC transporter permease n=1 Tax=Paraliobacillus sediminis TaxID=1885916 RepID=UPI000E3DE33B|nr:ABC transporter permease [Paraliobacillus sediminis]